MLHETILTRRAETIMKRSYKLGAHKVVLVTKPELGKKNLCGQAKYESKEVETRTTNIDSGRPYELASYLVVFLHEFFHMIDIMQGTGLFGDNDPELDAQKEVTLDGFCEGFVHFMLDNRMLKENWVKGVRELLYKTKPVLVEEEDAES